jgi:hypothetical protein
MLEEALQGGIPGSVLQVSFELVKVEGGVRVGAPLFDFYAS